MINIGARSGSTIAPISNFMKSTKVVQVTSASDIVLTGTSISNSVIIGAYIMAYADSSNNWRLRFNIRLNCTSGGVRTSATVTFQGGYPVTFKNISTFAQVVTATNNTATGTSALAAANLSSITVYHSSYSETSYYLSGDVELESEPTWAAANMENVQNISAYFETASAGIKGLVDNTATNTGGTPILGRTSGVAPSAGYIGEKITWATPPSTASSITGTSYADWTNAFITLSKGRWDIKAIVDVYIVTGTTSGNTATCYVSLNNSADGLVDYQEHQFYTKTTAAVAGGAQGVLYFATVVDVSADNTVYKLRYKFSGAAGGSASVNNQAGQYSQFYAIRIA